MGTCSSHLLLNLNFPFLVQSNELVALNANSADSLETTVVICAIIEKKRGNKYRLHCRGVRMNGLFNKWCWETLYQHEKKRNLTLFQITHTNHS